MRKQLLTLILPATFAASACDEPGCEEDATCTARGFSLPTYANGLVFAPDGIELANGESLSDGIGSAHGVSTSSPLLTSGLFSTGTSAGVLDTAAGRTFVTAMIECVLPTGQSLSKTVGGTTYTFYGKVGVAAAWKTSSCSTTCQQWVSACLLARSNATGTAEPIELRATNIAIGTGMKNPAYTEQDRAWFGNLFSSSPVAYQAWGANVPTDTDFLTRECDGQTPCFVGDVGYMSARCTASGSESASACTPSAGGTSYVPVTTHYQP